MQAGEGGGRRGERNIDFRSVVYALYRARLLKTHILLVIRISVINDICHFIGRGYMQKTAYSAREGDLTSPLRIHDSVPLQVSVM